MPPLLAWPVKFAATSYVLRVDVEGTAEDLPFPATGTLDTDRYYWITGDAQADADGGVGGVGDLLAMMQTALDAHSVIGTATVAIDTSDFTVDVTISGGLDVQLLWSHANTTLDATVFGWTQAADSIADNTITSPATPRGVWRPRRGITEDSRDRQPIIGGVSTALSGLTRVSSFGVALKQREMTFVRLPQEYVLAEYAGAADPYGAFETGWLSAWSLGWPIRCYDNEADVSVGAAAYSLYRTRSLADPISRNPQYKVRWDVLLEMQRVT